METITREYQVYTYDELSESAKEKVREWYIDDDMRPQIFAEDVDMWLSENFRESDLKVQFSLGYCQGDGLNIYGKVYHTDLLDKIDWSDFTAKEKKFILWAVNRYQFYTEIPSNWRYCYCIADRADFADDLRTDLESDCMRGINESALEKWDSACIDYFETLCGDFEKSGYKYLYEPDEDEIIDMCAANEWKFTEEGKIFY